MKLPLSYPKIVLAALALTGALLFPPVRSSAHVLLYRAPRLILLATVANQDCTFAEGVGGILNRGRQWWVRRQIERASYLKTTDPAGYELWGTPKGEYWTPRGSGRILPFSLAAQAGRLYGEVRPGDIVLDCGANVGVYTRQAIAQGAKLVVAIEPVPENVECLRRNLVREIALGRVIVYSKGVWDMETTLSIYANPNNSAADSFILRTASSQQTQRLPLTTIDKLVGELKLERVDYVKMNIEGAEQRALLGAQKTLATYRPRLALAVNHLATDAEKIPQLVRGAWPGYQSACGGACLELEGKALPEVMYFQ